MSGDYQFAVGIPTINQWPSLRLHLMLYAVDMPNIPFIIIDNGRQDIDLSGIGKPGQFTLMECPVNLGVAASWNFLIRMIHIDCEYACILNDDVYLGLYESEVNTIIMNAPKAAAHNDCMLIHGNKGFSAFIINREMYETVGPFDIDFYPAYFEDNDYVERMQYLNMEPKIVKELTPKVFYGSQSIQKDPSLAVNFEDNQKKFRDKWGYIPRPSRSDQ